MSAGYWDIHNHILPGLDDGSSCMEETYDLLEEEYRQGVRNIIFTPHYRPELFTVSAQDREEVYQKVCREMRKEFPELQFYLGCELFAHEGMEQYLQDERFRMAGTNLVLVEFSTVVRRKELIQRIRQIRQAGCRPVIAHAERYRCLHENEQELVNLKQEGALIQVNAGNILGRGGRRIRKFCKHALQSGLVDIIASDAHDMEMRPVELEACRKKLTRKYGTDADKWFHMTQEQYFGAT